jgi:hypothetical protein
VCAVVGRGGTCAITDFADYPDEMKGSVAVDLVSLRGDGTAGWVMELFYQVVGGSRGLQKAWKTRASMPVWIHLENLG